MDAAEKPKSGQTCGGTVPVKLRPGLLWDVALWEFGFVVGQKAFNTETLKV